MPKKTGKDSGEIKKKRSLSKDVRNASNSMIEDGLLPPTPAASHLFAFNPFDEPLENNVAHGGMYRGLVASSLHTTMAMTGRYPKGQPLPQSTWKSGLPSSVHPEALRFDGPLALKPGLVGMRTRGTRSTTYPTEPHMPSHSHFFGSQTLSKHATYPLGDAADDQMYRHHKLSHISHLHNSPNSNRLNSKKLEKDIKSDQVPWPAKKRRSKPAELPPKSVTWKGDKEWLSLRATAEDNSSAQPPVTNDTSAPHSILPMLPQICMQCNKDIGGTEDCICCLASCKAWYHRICSGLTETALNCLKTEELALWACDNCLFLEEIGSVRTRNSTSTPILGSTPNTPTRSTFKS